MGRGERAECKDLGKCKNTSCVSPLPSHSQLPPLFRLQNFKHCCVFSSYYFPTLSTLLEPLATLSSPTFRTCPAPMSPPPPHKSRHGKQKDVTNENVMKIYLLWQLGMDWQTCPCIPLHIFLQKEKFWMLDLYQFIKPVNQQAASDWERLFGNIRNKSFLQSLMLKYKLEMDSTSPVNWFWLTYRIAIPKLIWTRIMPASASC